MTQKCCYHLDECHLLKGKYDPFVLVLQKGEPLNEGILQALVAAEYQSAMIVSGIGAVTDVTLYFFNCEAREYEDSLFKAEYELTALSGNFTHLDSGEPAVHIHGVMGNREYQALSGHFASATIAVTGEINIIPLPGPMIRQKDAEISLNLINPKAALQEQDKKV